RLDLRFAAARQRLQGPLVGERRGALGIALAAVEDDLLSGGDDERADGPDRGDRQRRLLRARREGERKGSEAESSEPGLHCDGLSRQELLSGEDLRSAAAAEAEERRQGGVAEGDREA